MTICPSGFLPLWNSFHWRLQVPHNAAHASSPTGEGASTPRPSCNSYIGFQSANVCNSRSPCWCTRHCTTSYLRIWRKIINLCLSLDADNYVSLFGHWHVPSAANQYTSWRSLIRCCWTSRMEQSLPSQLRQSDITLWQFRQPPHRINITTKPKPITAIPAPTLSCYQTVHNADGGLQFRRVRKCKF